MMKLKGIPASPGTAIGKAFLYTDNDFPEIQRYTIGKDRLNDELGRLTAAFDDAEEELAAIHERALNEMGKEQADIFGAHLMMLQDPVVREEVETRITETLENAEWVVRETARALSESMAASDDPSFRDRAADINDIAKRILNKLLRSEKKSLSELDKDVIVAAHDILPSEILTMNKTHVKGLVIDQGGRTSHAAILARAFGIPTVLGLSNGVKEIRNDDLLVVDGTAGEVSVNPGQDELAKFRETDSIYIARQKEFEAIKNLPAQTLDGRRVLLKANIEIPEEAESALRFGAEGIGLYRSEFLFLSSGKAAEEEVQFEAYSKVLKTMGELPVTIRTIDIGGDKALPGYSDTADKNPLLGWRAIRFSLARPEIFKTQLRALLRAGVNGNMKIMFPLISGIEELEQALLLLEEAKNECREKGQAFPEKVETGIMIEVPAAAMTADILAEKSDFFSIGTNDLVQYTLAVDRGDERVNYLARPLHPAVIRFLKMTIDACHKRGIKAAMCGEMAGDPVLAPLLLGLGLDEFSMTTSSIPAIKKVIRGISMEDCRALATEILAGKSAAENNALIEARMKGAAR